MPYIPNDPWAICDITGKKVRMSQTRKTWDGYRVAPDVWYPKNPQEDLRAIPERSRVRDARPRQADVYQTPAYGRGVFTLRSPNGTTYVLYVGDDGSLPVAAGTWGLVYDIFYIGQYGVVISDAGVASLIDAGVAKNVYPWLMWTVSGLCFELSVAFGAVVSTLVGGPEYMDGVFTLTSPDGTNYVVYLTDDGAVYVRPGTWGPISSTFFLDNYKMTVANDGALLAVASGEQHPPSYRMISMGGLEYLWKVDADGAVKLSREGHWWDTPVTVLTTVYDKDSWLSGTAGRTSYGAVTESDQYIWLKE